MRLWRDWRCLIQEKPRWWSFGILADSKQDEIAEVLKISTVTVRRDWVFAKTWLYGELLQRRLTEMTPPVANG